MAPAGSTTNGDAGDVEEDEEGTRDGGISTSDEWLLLDEPAFGIGLVMP